MKLKVNRLLTGLLLIGSIMPVFSQEKIKDRTITYEGSIDKYPIKAFIQYGYSNKGSVYGKYIYTKYPNNEPIMLSGDAPKKVFTFREEVYDTKKGAFKTTGKFSTESFSQYDKLEGKWQNASTSNIVDFQLKAIEKNADVVYYYEINRLTCEEEDYNKYYYRFNRVKIFDENKKLIQTISLPDSFAYKESPLSVSLEDYNFDGYLDIVLSHDYPFVTRGDYGQYYLIYNPTSKQFVYNKSFNMAEPSKVILLNPLKQTLSTVTADGNGNESETTYTVIDNKLYKIAYWESTEENDLLEIKYKVINGKSVEISRRTK